MLIKNALIVGCGSMGQGIAYVMAKYLEGVNVHVIEPMDEQVTRARKNISHWQDKDRKKESISSTFAEKVEFFSSFESLPFNKYDLLLEAASEDMQVKKKIFSQFNSLSDSNTIIASNTSSLSITKMTNEISAEKKNQVLGLHFFNPPRVMKLLEIIVSELTSADFVEKAKQLGNALQKTTVVCKDAPGFITSRIGIIAVNEAIFVLQEGLSTAEEIDQGMKLGYNHPMGPLKLADFIGLDVVFAVTQSLYENYQDTKYRPPLLLRKKVEAGHLGVKTGKGFYLYH